MLVFKRFLHNPRGLQGIPIPRGASRIRDIEQVVGPRSALTSGSRSSPKWVQKFFPDSVAVEDLADQHEGKAWYFVERTRAGNVPVYTDYNNAGHCWTEVRKIHGSAGALKNDLKKVLDLPKKDIWVLDSSNRILIRGNHCARVRQILKSQF